MNDEVILSLKDIVERYKQGDKDACECLLEKFSPLIRKYSKLMERRCSDGEDMQSLVQIKTLEAILGFKE